MKTKFFLLTAFFFAAIITTQAQSIDEIVKEWERAKAYTKEYLDAMPEAGYSLKPTPEMRSFADQMLHITDGDYAFIGAATGVAPTVKEIEKSTTDKSKANVTKVVMDGYDFVISSIKKMNPASLTEKVKVFGQFEMTRKVAIEKAFEHQTHHRGQTTVYIRLAKGTPPQEKLF